MRSDETESDVITWNQITDPERWDHKKIILWYQMTADKNRCHQIRNHELSGDCVRSDEIRWHKITDDIR